jgi:sec-independent protein translocase protein TatA
MGLSWQHILLLMIVALLLFGGRGKISGLMGDFASGIKAFKKGLADDDSDKPEVTKTEPAKSIDHQATQSGEAAKKMDQPAQPAA